MVAPSDGNEFVLAPHATIVGRVVAEDGHAPIPEASVVASSMDRNWSEAHFTTVTATDGAFELPVAAGSYRVVATALGLRSREEQVRLELGSTSSSITLTTSRAASLRGVVRVAGTPCEQGFVALSGPVSANGGIDAEGLVNIDGLPPGKYETLVTCAGSPPAYGSVEVGLDQVSINWEIERAPESERIEPIELIEPEPLGAIRATLDQTQQTGAFLDVFAVQPGSVRRAIRQGEEFVIDQLPLGDYRVFAGDAKDRGVSVTLARDAEVHRVVVHAGPGAQISGRVMTDDGEPVPDCWVTHYRTDEGPLELRIAAPVMTDEEGGFAFAGSPGVSYSVSAQGPRGTGQVDGVTSATPARLIVNSDF